MAGFKYRRTSSEEMERKANQSTGNFEGFLKDEYQKYTAKKGDNAIRILPRHEDEEARSYSEEVWVHYNVGPDRASVLCPQKMAGAPCPVCEERVRAERRGDEEASKEMRPGRRIIFWILDRKDEARGVQVYDCPPTIDQGISKAAKDRETGKYQILEDPYEGYDIYFDRDGDGINTKYTGFQTGRRPTSVDEKYLDYITKNPLLDTLRIRTYDEIKALFEGGIASSSSEDHNRPDSKPQQSSVDENRPSSRPSLNREPTRDENEASLDKDKEFLQSRQEEPQQRQEPEREKEPAQASAPPSGASRAATLRERFAKR